MNRICYLVVAAVTAAAACAAAAVSRAPTDPWQSAAADDTLVTDPTPHFSADQITFLRDVAARTWKLLSGPGLNPATHLLRDSVVLAGMPGATVNLRPPKAAQEFTDPAVIGSYLSSIVAAKDLGVATPDEAQADAAATLSQIQKLTTYKGFFLRWYSTTTGAAIAGPRKGPVKKGYVSTVDNGWMAQGLLVAEQAFPTLASGFGALLDAMQWKFLYNATDNLMYNGYQIGKGYSKSEYDKAYSGPRIIDDMAIGSGKVPGALWWGPARTPPSSHRQRQTPQGQTDKYTDPQNHRSYSLFEGHYVYDHIKFVPTFNGSLYQALAPELVVPEQTMAPAGLGLNDRNTALAQGAYGTYGAKSQVWGWAAAMAPTGKKRYTNYGAADLGTNQGVVPHVALPPYAAFLTLPIIPDQAYANISKLVSTYPTIENQYGFLDSVNIDNGTVAHRFMASDQMAILMSIDNAVDHNQLQSYFASSPYATKLAPYMKMERYSINGLASS